MSAAGRAERGHVSGQCYRQTAVLVRRLVQLKSLHGAGALAGRTLGQSVLLLHRCAAPAVLNTACCIAASHQAAQQRCATPCSAAATPPARHPHPPRAHKSRHWPRHSPRTKLTCGGPALHAAHLRPDLAIHGEEAPGRGGRRPAADPLEHSALLLGHKGLQRQEGGRRELAFFSFLMRKRGAWGR